MTVRRSAVLLLPALALSLTTLSGCGGGSDAAPSSSGAVTAAGPAQAQTATVEANSQLKFAPETVRAKVGTLALTMTIVGGVPHNLVFDDASVGAPLATTPSGSVTGTYTFTKPGTYRFECTIHKGMVGQVIVS